MYHKDRIWAQYFSLCSSMTLFHLWPSRLKSMPITRHYISNTRKRRTASPTWNYSTPLLVPRIGHSSGIWHGQFGHSKTNILSTNESNLQQAITPTIEKQPIAIIRDHRHLGITLTSDLNWPHMCNLLSAWLPNALAFSASCHISHLVQ